MSLSTQMNPSTQVALNTYPSSLALTPEAEAEAECEALEGLFQMSLETESQLSTTMDRAILRMQNAYGDLMERFQVVSAVNDELNTRVIQATSRGANLTHVDQAHQEAQDSQIKHMHRQIERLEQEKAEMLRQQNEEAVLAARRQDKAAEAVVKTTQAQIEALHRIHTSVLATMRDTHTSAIETLSSQLTHATNNHRDAITTIVQKEQEIQRSKEELSQTQTRLQNTSQSFQEEAKRLTEENLLMRRLLEAIPCACYYARLKGIDHSRLTWLVPPPQRRR